MGTTFTHDTFISPCTWRYGSESMRALWSEEHKRKLLRTIWIALAKAQQTAGIVTQEQVDDLIAHKDAIDIERSSEIEREIRHDLMAEIKTYAEQCPVGGSIIHLGATSMDLLDNMDVIRQREALDLIIALLDDILYVMGEKIATHAHTPCMAFTHIQPAEPTTIGYRLAQTAQDLLADVQLLTSFRSEIRGKGMKGAVGTSASYTELLAGTPLSAMQLEQLVMEELHLVAFDAATQVYPRKQDWRLGTLLAGVCASLAKFALDLRILQSPPIGEWSEPFGAKQVGSSAMPFKRNPINAEKIDSLCRFCASQVQVLWHNAADTILERTLDDSANRRLVIPELFLATEEALISTRTIIKNMQFHDAGRERNLSQYGLFAACERLLMELGRRGADRQEMHEVIREHSLVAWPEVQEGKPNPLISLLQHDNRVTAYITRDTIEELMNASQYIGDAPERALIISETISRYVSLKKEN